MREKAKRERERACCNGSKHHFSAFILVGAGLLLVASNFVSYGGGREVLSSISITSPSKVTQASIKNEPDTDRERVREAIGEGVGGKPSGRQGDDDVSKTKINERVVTTNHYPIDRRGDGSISPTVDSYTRFAIVTPTYQGHFEQNVRFLLTLLRNCVGCENILIQFVLTYKEDPPAMFQLLTSHPALKTHINVTLHTPKDSEDLRYYQPEPPVVTGSDGASLGTNLLEISILPLRTAYEYMGVPVEETLLRTYKNKRWMGKYTHLSIKKYAGAFFAFGSQGIDVVWWLDSEAYLWKRGWRLLEMLEREWRRPRVYWSKESHYKRNSEVHEVCPRNGTLPVHEAFESKRPHLFSSSFYLLGKPLFEHWTAYVEDTWKRRFADIFLALGQKESGYILHIIETQMIAYLGGCQSLHPVPEPCKKYQVIEVNSALGMLFTPEKVLNDYLQVMEYQGQFEHIFKHYLNPRFQGNIKKVVGFFELPSFRIDHYYSNCTHLKSVLDGIVSGDFPETAMALQTNSDDCVAKIVMDPTCHSTLPITCGEGAWNETCSLNQS